MNEGKLEADIDDGTNIYRVVVTDLRNDKDQAENSWLLEVTQKSTVTVLLPTSEYEANIDVLQYVLKNYAELKKAADEEPKKKED